MEGWKGLRVLKKSFLEFQKLLRSISVRLCRSPESGRPSPFDPSTSNLRTVLRTYMCITNGHLSSMAAYKCTTLSQKMLDIITLLYILLSNSIKNLERSGVEGEKGRSDVKKSFLKFQNIFRSISVRLCRSPESG